MEKIQGADVRWLHDRSWATSWRSWLWRRPTKVIAASLLLILCIKLSHLRSSTIRLSPQPLSDRYLDHGDFDPLAINGFVNHGKTNESSCAELRYDGIIQVQQSFHLHDDIIEIAHALEHHPRVDYTGQDQSLSHNDVIFKTWLQLAQSSVWLDKYQVYLAVSRIVFYDTGNKAWSCISFVRGQVYDKDWNELRGHIIHWQGQEIIFPTIFEISSPYTREGAFYGPEDPRVIIEQDVDDAEPIIVFNMISDVKELTRAMYIHRPFSNFTTILSINGVKERNSAEKNWMPFFYRDAELTQQEKRRWPNYYIHFVYAFHPLEILRCHIYNGWCDFVYRQNTGAQGLGRHMKVKGRMSGGTNLEPVVSLDLPGSAVYVGFPRTHIEAACTKEAMYRPELMVMTAFNNSFHLDYMSDSIQFGDKAMTDSARDDPCGEGRILIMNSISKWDRDAGEDVMTLSFTVDDSTTQVLRLSGVAGFVLNLPYIGNALEADSSTTEDLQRSRWSIIGVDVLECSVEASFNYSLATALPSNGTDLRKQREDAEKEAREREKKLEEDKQKQAEDNKQKEEDEKQKEEEAAKQSDAVEKKKQAEEETIQETIEVTKAEAARKSAEENARTDSESRGGKGNSSND